MTDGWSECRQIIAHHSKSFDLASRLLPRERRSEVAALYAWCRLCDDAIDLAPSSEHPHAIRRIRHEIESVYDAKPQSNAVLDCFQRVVQRRRIPIEYPLELLEGMRMDVDRIRYAETADLLVYCWRVAGTVGLMMSHVLGVSDRRAASHAAHLGIGMQLTNIARDVAEDWERGRVYLPDSLMAAPLREWFAQNTRADPPPLPAAHRAELASTTHQLLDVADLYYKSADQGMLYLEPRSALAIRTARMIYSDIGRTLEARGYDVLSGRAIVPRRRKLALALRVIPRFISDIRSWDARDLVAPDGVLGCEEALKLQ